MKAGLLFLLKFLAYSLALFSVGHPLLHGYATLLEWSRGLMDAYPLPVDLGKMLYDSSMTMTAFFALMLSTPRIPILKKAAAAAAGLIAFFLTDLFFIQCVIFPPGRPIPDESSPALAAYLFVKWLLPFLLWILPSYPYLGELFKVPKGKVS